MPVYACLTPGDPPQMEFVPFGSNHKYPKLIGGYLIFKFPSKAHLARAIPCAENLKGYGLYQITRRDFGTNYSPRPVKDIEDFAESLDKTGWCDRCQDFSAGIRFQGKCLTCDKPTR